MSKEDDFQWHSVTGFDSFLAGSEPKKEVRKVALTKEASANFVFFANEFLVHKTTKALWKISEDGKSIEAVFDGDVLTEDQF